MAVIQQYYDYLFDELGDRRVKGYPFTKDPLQTIIVVTLYLLTVYVILPAYMKNRKRYSLKNVIFYYNIFQIAACATLIYGVATSGWTTHYSWGCQPIDYSDDPLAVRMLYYTYLTFLLKKIELIETIFFILRKKYSQVSNLHVYHHSSTVLLGWVGVKYVGGGMATFPIMANCLIHIMMYIYYMLASLGPEWQKTLRIWKPRLTIAQMIQFAILVGHSLQALHPDCHVPKGLLWMYVPNVGLISYMFWKFYQENYIHKKGQKTKSK